MSSPAGLAVAAQERIRRTVRAAGLRATSGRVAVMDQLLAEGRPVTHADPCGKLGPRGFDRVSLFRNLLAVSNSPAPPLAWAA